MIEGEKMKYEYLAKEGKIGKLAIKNRIVVPALNNNYTHAAFMTPESIDFYVSKAKGGAGLVIVEATSVDYPRSRSVLNPAIDDEKYIPGFKAIADGCHKYGAKVFVQLSHVGRQSRRSTTGMDPVAPSPIASKSPLYPDTPKVLEKNDIEEIVGMFAKAAGIAKKAGLDGVEIIMAHGYLANNFLSPISNQRTDEYGGLKGGIKFCTDIVEAIKAECGKDYPIVCRINGDDYIKENGNGIVEAELISQCLEKAGADALNVSGGMRDSELSFNDHSSGQPHGAWIHLSDRIKRVVGIPVMIVKRFTPEIAEATLKAEAADFIAFGKQAICDSDFAGKILSGHVEDMIPCTSCCQGCYDELWMKKPITCMVNPSVGRKMEYLKERSEKKRAVKKVLIVGAGPAGCELALELARFGHTVTLIDKNNFLGGNYFYCSYTELKKEVGNLFVFFRHALLASGVDLRLNTPFSTTLVDDLQPDVVVDATGAEFKKLGIPGDSMEKVISPKDALDGSHQLGKYVTVVACGFGCPWTCRVVSNEIPDDVVGLKTNESYACAAGHAACDVAEDLADKGYKVTIITARDKLVPGMGFTNRGNMFKRFFPKNVNVSVNTKVLEVIPEGLLCMKEGITFKVSADTVIASTKLESTNSIEKYLSGYKGKFYKIGDAKEIGNALKAFHRAYELADEI